MNEPGAAAEADRARILYTRERIARWDSVGAGSARWHAPGDAYRRRLQRVYRQVVPPGLRVLELGCGTGDLLASLEPSFGVGVDFSAAALARAARRHPGLRFVRGDVHDVGGLEGPFDAIVLSDLLNDLWDVQGCLEAVARLATPRTRIVFNVYSHLWEWPLRLARRLGLTKQVLEQNWLTGEDVHNLLELAKLKAVKRWTEVLLPLPVPLLAAFADEVLVKLWPFRLFAVANFAVVRARGPRLAATVRPAVSVIVPARNEEGNVRSVFERTEVLGADAELVFVEGHSTDGTRAEIERQIAAHPSRRARLLVQEGRGKGDAVRLGFDRSSGEILVILDADLTVPPEDLPRFVKVLREGTGELVNGVRLVYPMERQAMRFLNLLGNKAFCAAFTFLLGQPLRDTLCGTKAVWRDDWERISEGRKQLGDFDPFGDFDLLFGAAKLGLDIVEVPVRYRERVYGETNIKRWRHGLLLLRMAAFAAARIKFV